MWALPEIHRLNEEASRLAKVNLNKTEKQLCRGERCEMCDSKAVHATPWYDVFSDDPKGYIYQCKKHSMEGLPEGYFYCDRCGRDFIENYTWEYYFHDDPKTCERICLNCALDDEINNDENWITNVKEVTFDRVREAKHLIPVKGEHWTKYLHFIGNTTLDSMTGAKVTGFSSSSTREDGLSELRDLVAKALGEAGKCSIILDGAYQFAVSLGVYTWNEEKKNYVGEKRSPSETGEGITRG
jgi:hypothetical protein